MTVTDLKFPKYLYKYIIVLFILTFFLRIILISYCNSSYGGIEQNAIYGIQRILLGQTLYQDPTAGTYAVMQYTPLYYYITAYTAKTIGISGNDVQSIYALCRVLALIFNLLTVVTVAMIIRSWRFSWFQSYVFAMPVLILLTYHFYTRGDSMYLFLFAMAVYAYIRYSRYGGLRYIIIAALFSAACIMTKQSGILVGSIISYCLLFADRKLLTALFYCLATLFFAILLAMSCIHGNWHALYQNACLGLKNGIDGSFLYLMFISQFFAEMVPCYFLGGIIVWLAVKKITGKIYWVVATGAAISFLFAVITGLKIGSSNNYFIEFLVFVIISLPYLLHSEQGAIQLFRLFGYPMSVRYFAYVAFVILITSKTLGLFTAVYIEKSYKNDKTEYANESTLREYFNKTLNVQNGEYIFFTDRLFFDNLFIEHAIMPNKDVVSQVYSTDHTTFDYSAFISGMNNGLVKYIVTDKNKPDINEWNKYIPFILFDKSRFRLLATYRNYSIYIYAPTF